jgi:hypothetical protein
MIAALVHGQLSLGAPIALPTRTWERAFAGR